MASTRARLTFLLVFGVSWWVSDALVLRYSAASWLGAGQIVVAMSFVSAIGFVAIATYPAYQWLSLPQPAGLCSAALIALPGAIADILAVTLGHLYPDLATIGSARFVAWFGWTYGLILVTGLIPFPHPSTKGSLR